MSRFHKPVIRFGVRTRLVPPARSCRITGLWNQLGRFARSVHPTCSKKVHIQTRGYNTRISHAFGFRTFPRHQNRRAESRRLNEASACLNGAIKPLFGQIFSVGEVSHA